MNIPEELVAVANTCDLYGLRHEADILTEIARQLMESGQEVKLPQKQLMLEEIVAPNDQPFMS